MTKMYQNFEQNIKYLNDTLRVDSSFDIVNREILIGERNAVFYFVDGFCKDELMQKLLQFLMGIKKEDMPQNANEMNKFFHFLRKSGLCPNSHDQNSIIIINKVYC